MATGIMDLPTNARLTDEKSKVYGVVIGIVTDNVHPDKDYSVKVRYPGLSDGTESSSFWVRICTWGAGKNQAGMYVLPEIDDEVLVAFLNGDRQNPIVIGTLWNSRTKPWRDNESDPKSDSPKGKNHVRGFLSRIGHVLEFNDDDTDSLKNGKITIRTKHKHLVELDDKDGALRIHVTTGDENQYLTLDETNKKITMESKNGDIEILAKQGDVKIEAKTIHSKSTEDTEMKAKNWKTQADSNFELKGGGTGEVNSTSTLTVKGSMVNIN